MTRLPDGHRELRLLKGNTVHLGYPSGQIPPLLPLVKGGWRDLLEREVNVAPYVSGIVLKGGLHGAICHHAVTVL